MSRDTSGSDADSSGGSRKGPAGSRVPARLAERLQRRRSGGSGDSDASGSEPQQRQRSRAGSLSPPKQTPKPRTPGPTPEAPRLNVPTGTGLRQHEASKPAVAAATAAARAAPQHDGTEASGPTASSEAGGGMVADPCSELRCAHFGSCSGCDLQSGLRRPPLYGEAVSYFRGLGLDSVEAVMGPAHGWRCRAKLAVRGNPGRPLLGLFRRGSHTVVDIAQPAPGAEAGLGAGMEGGAGPDGEGGGGWAAGGGCAAHHPRINAAAALIQTLAAELGIPPYVEEDPAPSAGRPPKHTGAAPAPPPPQPSSRPLRGRAARRLPSPSPSPYASPTSTPGTPSHAHRDRNISDRDSGGGGGSQSQSLPRGLLRYVQLTAVPSAPGGRAEVDPGAGVQAVLVLAAQPPPALLATAVPSAGGGGAGEHSLTGGAAAVGRGGGGAGGAARGGKRGRGREEEGVEAAMELCRRLWEQAGPGGPLQPWADSAAPSPPSPAASHDTEPTTSTPTPSPTSSGSASAARSPLIHSLWLNFQPDPSSNAVLGPHWLHVAGPAAAWQDFGGVAACVGPGSFVQANYGAMQEVLRRIGEMVPPGSRVTELHAGIGVIGLSLAASRALASLRLVEINPHAAAPFAASLDRLRRREPRPPLPTHIDYVTAEAGSAPGAFLAGCDVLVVDPPRKGLGPSLLAALTTPAPAPAARGDAVSKATETGAEAAGSKGAAGLEQEEAVAAAPATGLPRRLVYLSCGFRALQGDLAALVEGGWALRSASAHMFFPGTDSLETLVLLERE
ncbi:hypothetical protein HYH03_004841 [Edaphochlamys debaryana]|uniref:S-adenosyl-L-methionine-dependent methyltransferase n=1 Tax=Edaphochlamys debaryana TaxID=47281 RepID=A0A835Y934_9CHLO|nr:hypothetical protein HYH03_004841 [Edaphochlamys debaryana]|eukprot:KAG2497257.1 hypothetical protein HYH03_004841 [Edaphochlamys debaryana]